MCRLAGLSVISWQRRRQKFARAIFALSPRAAERTSISCHHFACCDNAAYIASGSVIFFHGDELSVFDSTAASCKNNPKPRVPEPLVVLLPDRGSPRTVMLHHERGPHIMLKTTLEHSCACISSFPLCEMGRSDSLQWQQRTETLFRVLGSFWLIIHSTLVAARRQWTVALCKPALDQFYLGRLASLSILL